MMFIATAAALFASLAAAAPPSQEHGINYVQLTYQAPDGNWVVNVPINQGSVPVGSSLSFSHIVSVDPTGHAACYSTGVDRDPTGAIVITRTYGSQTVDIGPPQVQTTVYCVSN